MIRITIHTQGVSITAPKDRAIRAQINRSLQRFDNYVRAVDVHIKDINGPRGGQDMSVLMRVQLRGMLELAASARRSNLLAATSSANNRVRRQVKRAIRRQQSFDRMDAGRNAIYRQLRSDTASRDLSNG